MRACCIDQYGNEKRKYKTKEEAEEIAQYRRDDGIGVKVYECMDRDGWHLTSHNAPTPIRPKNVMTREDRLLLRKQKTARLGDAIGEEVVTNLKNEIKKNSLIQLEEKIQQLKQDVEEKSVIICNYRKQFARLRQAIQAREQDLKESKRSLSRTENEYERVKRQINK